jgi:Putative auto-transporter adhesin, head GIN domain
MKKLSIAFIIGIGILMTASCKKLVFGDGAVETEIRSVNNFTGLTSSISGTINYSISPTFKVEIIAQRNIINILETYLSNGKLVIRYKDAIAVSGGKDVIINVTAPSLDYVHLSGSGTINVLGNVVSNLLTSGVSGSGDIYLSSIQLTDKLIAAVSGSGGLHIWSGTVPNALMTMSGSGKIIADAVTANTATASISGSGTMQIKVLQSLNASISGSGDIYYRGTPSITANISGSGKIRQL